VSSVDPRRLIPALQEYEHELRRWMDLTGSTAGDAEYTHRYGTESLEQVRHRLAVEASRAEHDAQRVRQVRADHTALVETAAATLKDAHRAYQVATQAAHDAKRTVLAWEANLHSAELALQAARRHLEATRQDLRDAEHDRSRAYSQLRQAESNLESCKSDSRNNCSAQAMDVAQAAAQVRACEAAVVQAEREVRRAEQLVQDAERRVVRCRQALEFAHQADDIAQYTLPVALDAVSQAERALESLQIAENHLKGAEDLTEEQQLEVNAGKMHLHHGTEHLDLATQNLSHFQRHADVSGNYNQQARRELQHRQDDLRELNRPDLGLP